jgi:uncharacterized protein YegJ (DUF2314 family)
MSDMDLIPGDYRQGQGLKRLLNRFFLICVLIACLVGGVRLLFTYLIWRENVQVVSLEQQEQVTEQNKSRTEAYRQQMQVTQQQLAALNELRGRDRVAPFLIAIDESFSEGVWFDGMRFMRGVTTGSLENLPGNTRSGILVVPAGGAVTQNLDSNPGVEIVGHAVSHSLLAEFMRRLGANAHVADLRLIDTSTRNYTTVQVVDFKLTLQMKKAQGSP